MTDKSNKYGYVGVDIPAQSFGNNKGVFNPAEINELVADNKWTQYGQLELIETQTVTSSTATVDFTSLGNYNVHFLTVSDLQATGDARVLYLRFSNDGGSSFISSSNYDYANQEGDSSGTFSENISSTASFIRLQEGNGGSASNEVANGYVYLYNLLDSAKYSFTTYQITQLDRDVNYSFNFSSGVLHTAETHNAFRLYFNADNISKAKFSLYGIKES